MYIIWKRFSSTRFIVSARGAQRKWEICTQRKSEWITHNIACVRAGMKIELIVKVYNELVFCIESL